MTLNKLIKGSLLMLLLLASIQPVGANDTSTEATETVVIGEDNEQITTPAPTDSVSVNWCDVGKFATGYAVRSGDIPSPSSSDPYLVTPQKSYLADSCFNDFASAKQRAASLSGTENQVPVVIIVGADHERIAYAKYGVVLLNNSQTTATFTIHTSPNSSTKKTYVNATSQRDALLLDTPNADWAQITMSGVTGYLKLSNSVGTYIHQIVPASFIDKTTMIYNGAAFQGYKLTRYAVNPNDSSSMYLDVLRGTSSSNLVTSGNADRPSFMSTGSNQVYYSYDNHYFYTQLVPMIEDYQSKTYSRALNQSPYYNYYQYLPARAKTRMSGAAFDAFLTMNRPTAGDNVTLCYSSTGVTVNCGSSYAYRYSGPQSILYKNGNAFLQGQDNYGINAALIYVKATLEGAYGMSTISRAKFNPFGVNANDSSPFTSATKYNSVYDGVESQFRTLMSLGYVNPYDGGGRYNGSHVGDKQSGMNTLYASDPNWGFKLASLYRELDKLSGFSDLNYYQVAVSINPSINLYASSTGSEVRQVMKQQTVVNNYVFDAIDMPMIVVEGQQNGRYKVVLDKPSDASTGYYYANATDYAYVNASDVRLINTPKSGLKDPKDIGSIIEDTATNVVTYDVPKVLKTTSNTSLFDSYRSDITSATTPVSSNQSFVAIREVKTNEATFYEVITDYTRAPARTKWLKASTISFSDSKIVTTQGSSLNVRSAASTTSTSKGIIQSDRAPMLYVSTHTGTAVNNNTTWYQIVLNPLTGETGYISGAFAVLGAGGTPTSSTNPSNPNYSSNNRVKNLFLNQNPYLLGTGVLSGVDAPNSTSMQYVLQFVSGATVFTHPLKTTTSLISLSSDYTFNPTGVYNYEYAWYEGTIDFYGVIKQGSTTYQSLPSGTYKLQVMASGGGKNEAFALINGDGLGLGSLVNVDSKLSYQISQDNNNELSITVNNTNTDSSVVTPGTGISNGLLLVNTNNRIESLQANGSILTIGGYSFATQMNYNNATSFERDLILVNTTSNEFFSYPLTAIKNTFLTNHAGVNPGKTYNLDYAFFNTAVDTTKVKNSAGTIVSLPSGEYAAFVRMSANGSSGHVPLTNPLNVKYVAGTSFSTGSYNNTSQMRVVVSNGGTAPTTPTQPTQPGSNFDLKRYSTNTYPIYPNSRVTRLAMSGNTLTIEGYSLEQFVNYSRSDSVWREIIFISEDQTRAYRSPLTAIYNPFLNANKTINPNGTYNYNYAFYKTSVNLNNIQEYWSKKPTSMPAGNYRVFIRMSDGKRSNVMSLRNTKDEVKMPSAFYFVEGSNDVGFKR